MKHLSLGLAVFACVATPLSASVLNVPGNYPTIQAAVNAAAPGDTVLVANGTYSGAGNVNVNTLGKAITVKSVGGASLCTIDCAFAAGAFVVNTGEGLGTVIEGFLVRDAGAFDGLSVQNASPTIIDCAAEYDVGTAKFVNSTSQVWSSGFEFGVTGGGPTFDGCWVIVDAVNSAVVINGGTFFHPNLTPGLKVTGGSVSATGCNIAYNQSPGAWLINTTAAFDTCNIYGNSGGGLKAQGSTLTMQTCYVYQNIIYGNSGHGAGMSLHNSTATLQGCTVTQNQADAGVNGTLGGGIASFGSTLALIGCTVSLNIAGDDRFGDGGGAYFDAASTVTVIGSLFANNIAQVEPLFTGWGGGVRTECPVTYVNSTFFLNTGDGGGIFATAPQTIINCEFIQNSADSVGGALFMNAGGTVTDSVFAANGTLNYHNVGAFGGAVYLTNAVPVTFERCLFSGNTNIGDPGPDGGGAIFSNAIASIENCIFFNNSDTQSGYGGALNLTAADSVANCTFWGNSAPQGGGAIYCRSAGGLVANSIIRNNSPNSIGGSSPMVVYSNIQGGFFGAGNFDANPLFVNPGNGDFRLGAGSPCIDSADNTSYFYNSSTDYLHGPRFKNDPSTLDSGVGPAPIVDMGAIEYTPIVNPCPWGPIWTEQSLAGDQFGSSVDVSGKTMVVGAFSSSARGEDSGAAYIHSADGKGGWTLTGELIAPGTKAGDFFGASASMDGDLIAVGAPRNDELGSNAGAVSIFRPIDGEWIYEATLLAPDGVAGNQFGYSVAVSGDTVLVGAWKASHDGVPGAGKAYVFQYRKSNWECVATLVQSDAHPGDAFGRAVDLSGDLALVGAPGAFEGAGAASIFRRAGDLWFQEAALQAADPAPGDQFGYAVGISGDQAIVGAPWHDAPGMADSGAAYLFQGSFGVWEFKATVADTLQSEGANVGFGVDIEGSITAVGAPGAHGRGGVRLELGIDDDGDDLIAPDAAAGDAYGARVVLDAGVLAVAAPFRDGPAGKEVGAVYPVSLFGCPPIQCYADFNADEALDLFDFLGFVNSFNAGEDRSDCTLDGSRDLFDFLCFVNEFNAGC